jgi:hypothetical protein
MCEIFVISFNGHFSEFVGHLDPTILKHASTESFFCERCTCDRCSSVVLTCVPRSLGVPRRCSTVLYDRISAYITCMFTTRVTSSKMARLPLRISSQHCCLRFMASSRRSPRHHRRPWDFAIRPRLRGILTCRDPDISPPSQALFNAC